MAETTPLRPADVFMHLIVAFLAPMFLAVSGGDLHHARLAAIETVNTYRSRDPMDLLSIAQIVAFGLTTLSSLSLSLAEDLSLSMMLRLRGNATALNRATEKCRKALREAGPAGLLPQHLPDPDAGGEEYLNEETVLANLSRAEHRIAEREAPAAAPQPPAPAPAGIAAPAAAPQPPAPAPAGIAAPAAAPQPPAPAPAGIAAPAAAPQPPAPAPAGIAAPAAAPQPPAATPAEAAERQHRTAWAAGMILVAREVTANLESLSPTQRQAATIQAAAMTEAANDLMSHAPMPPPFDLGEIGRHRADS
jgi:hypothetical protein